MPTPPSATPDRPPQAPGPSQDDRRAAVAHPSLQRTLRAALELTARDLPEFDAGLRELAAQLYPEAALTELTSEHPVYSSHFQLKPVPAKPLLGVDLPLDQLTDAGRKLVAKDAASRTVLVYSPTAIGCAWNQDMRTSHERSFQLGINLFRYAMGNAPLKRPLDGASKPIAAPAGPPPAPPRTGGQEPTLK